MPSLEALTMIDGCRTSLQDVDKQIKDAESIIQGHERRWQLNTCLVSKPEVLLARPRRP